MSVVRIELDHGEYVEIEQDPGIEYWHLTAVDACPHESIITLWNLDQRLALANALVDGVFVADPAGLWALIQEYAHAYYEETDAMKFDCRSDWAMEALAKSDELRMQIREQIRAALGITEGSDG